MKRYLSLFLLLPTLLFGSTQPELTAHDAVEVLKELTTAHASEKELSAPLLQRAIEQYLELLDSTKTYLLATEVEPWQKMDEKRSNELIERIKDGDFSHFISLHNVFVQSIDRRERLESEVAKLELPEEANYETFAKTHWCSCEDELRDRLLLLRALQTQAVKRLDAELQPKAFQRIDKRRQVAEEEAMQKDSVQRERLILSNVLKAFSSAFDSHTAYFTPAEASQFMIQVQQRLFGIGAQLRDDLSGFSIVKIIDGGPASRDTGLKEGDLVIAIDDEPVVGYEITDAVQLIRGPEGTIVNLTVLRGDETHTLPITRGEVVIQEARIESSTIPYGNGVIARIALHAFYQDPSRSSSMDVYDALHKIRKEHKIKGVILDLRNNSGGVLPQAVAVTGLFITKGVVVSIKDNEGQIERLRDVDGKMAYDGPLVVLTSKATASAAEIVAQTLQDYGRAIIVGDEHTYGKGTFQTFTLDSSEAGVVNPKGEFKVTRGRYYTVSGRSPQLKGVIPDIVVPGILSKAEIGEKFTKYPLDYDEIEENYHDDLSDIPAMQREQISWLYRFNLQQKLKIYTRFLPILTANSKRRQEEGRLYQSFLSDLNSDEVAPARVELYTRSDPQLTEGINILKDLILLLN